MKLKDSMLKKISAIVLVMSMTAVSAVFNITANAGEPVQLGVSDDTPAANVIDYQMVTENSAYAMFADFDKGNLAIENKQTGMFWYSNPNDLLLDECTKGVEKINMKSQLLIEYMDRSAEAKTATAPVIGSFSCLKNGSIKVTPIKDGIKVIYDFGEIGFVVPAEFRIDENGFTAEVNTKELKEGNKNFIVAIHVLPFFGAANRDKDGYVLIPDGSGAIINFNENCETTYDKPVYGREAALNLNMKIGKDETIHMPVFGTVYGSEALFAVITQGAGAASIVAKSCSDSYGYCHVASKLNYRTMTQKVMFENDQSNRRIINHVSRVHYSSERYTVRYNFLWGDKANYIGMAECYRDYLSKEKGLAAADLSPKFNVDIYGAIDTKSTFLGIQYTKITPLTTFSQAKKIIGEMNKKGIDNISVRYIGWTGAGIDNIKALKNADPLKILGGLKGWKTLSEELDNQLYAESDIASFRKSANGVNIKRDSVKASFGENIKQYKYMRSVYATNLLYNGNYLITPKRVSEKSERFFASAKKNGITQLGLSLIGSTVYSNFDPDNGCYRDKAEIEFEKILKNASADGYKIELSAANAYAFPYADRILSVPVTSGKCDGFSQDIPFYQAVLHGIIPMSVPAVVQTDDPKVTILKAVETGCELLYAGIYSDSSVITGTAYDSLYSTTYNYWMNSAAASYLKYKKYLDTISDKKIVAHSRPADGVTRTDFEEGNTVYVNYTDSQVNVEGNTIPAEDFLWVGGNW